MHEYFKNCFEIKIVTCEKRLCNNSYNFSGKINKKLDILKHILISINENRNKNAMQNILEFSQLQTKEELEEFEKLLTTDERKQEEFVSDINGASLLYFHMLII